MHIRAATNLDRDNVYKIHWSAFESSERELVAELAVNLLAENAVPRVISLVAENDGVVAGHVAFSPVTSRDNENFLGYILAPLAVKPDYQKCSIGSKLIESGVQQLSTMGVQIIFVYGDPEYYSRFGFRVDVAEPYMPPHKLHYPFGWQGLSLKKYSIGKPSVKIVCVDSLNHPELW
jgi:putative acetyltransferase